MEILDVHLGMITLPEETLPCDFICDIDGTIADLTHRRHWVAGRPKNWKAFEMTMDQDLPITRVINKVKELQKLGCAAIMCSGRGEQSRKVTEDWLEYAAGVTPSRLYMRAEKDYRADDIIKSELYDQILADGFNPKFVLDDRDKVVEMWRKRGLVCVQVAEGDF